MLSRLVLFVALALTCPANAFPLSALFAVTPGTVGISATQLLSLRDGTYLALVFSSNPLAQRALNPSVQTISFGSQYSVGSVPATNIVARIRPTNNSVIWAYAINVFGSPAYAVVDDARSIFVVGDSSVTTVDFVFGFRVLRFSVDGEVIWKELYTDEEFGRPSEQIAFTGGTPNIPHVGLAGPRTLAIVGAASPDRLGLGRSAVFVDTITRKAREVRFPLPDRQFEDVIHSAMAADPASGAACFADVTSAPNDVLTARLFVQCANAEGGGEVVSRVLVPYQANTGFFLPLMIMAGGGEGNAAVLYVVAIRLIVSGDTSTDPEKSGDVNEMLLFKLDPTTLQDVEWESGLISTKPTRRRLLLTASYESIGNYLTNLEYIRERNTLVVLFESGRILDGVETLADGTVALRGDPSMAGDLRTNRQWLLYFGNDPEPVAVRIPDDPRPDGGKDDFDWFRVADLEVSEDRRDLYLFGGLETFSGYSLGNFRYGELITFPFPIPEFAQPCAGSAEMEDGLGDGVDESLEPSADETAEAIMDEEVEPSSNPLLEQDI